MLTLDDQLALYRAQFLKTRRIFTRLDDKSLGIMNQLDTADCKKLAAARNKCQKVFDRVLTEGDYDWSNPKSIEPSLIVKKTRLLRTVHDPLVEWERVLMWCLLKV